MNEAKLDKFVIPGEIVGTINSQSKLKIGHGLLQNKDSIKATKAGFIRKQGNFYWLENDQKRYIPNPEDLVIGRIEERLSENYRVDVGSSFSASLGLTDFEGATKRNKTILAVDSIVYGRVTVANKDMEPEMVCMTKYNRAEGFGELKGGYLFKCSLGLCARLLSPDCPILNLLGKDTPFEIAVGMNGLVWLNAETTKQCIYLSSAILASQ